MDITEMRVSFGKAGDPAPLLLRSVGMLPLLMA